MTTQDNMTAHGANQEQNQGDSPASAAMLETVSQLVNLVYRNRLACAALNRELAGIADDLLAREAEAFVAIRPGTRSTDDYDLRMRQVLWLSKDDDYGRLKQRERDIRREIARREADIERALLRIQIMLAALPFAQVADLMVPQEPSDSSRGA